MCHDVLTSKIRKKKEHHFTCIFCPTRFVFVELSRTIHQSRPPTCPTTPTLPASYATRLFVTAVQPPAAQPCCAGSAWKGMRCQSAPAPVVAGRMCSSLAGRIYNGWQTIWMWSAAFVGNPTNTPMYTETGVLLRRLDVTSPFWDAVGRINGNSTRRTYKRVTDLDAPVAMRHWSLDALNKQMPFAMDVSSQ